MNIFNRNKYTANQEANYITLLNASFTEKKQEIVIKRKYKHFGNVLKVLSYNDSFLISASSNNNLYLYKTAMKYLLNVIDL